MDLLRSMAASLWPQRQIRWWYPAEPTMLVRGTVASGMIEWLVFGYLEFVQFRSHFLGQAGHFANGNEGTQVAALFVIVLAELFYPLSLFLIIMSAEGFIRAVAGAIVGQTVPTFWLAAGVKIWRRFGSGAKPLPTA